MTIKPGQTEGISQDRLVIRGGFDGDDDARERDERREKERRGEKKGVSRIWTIQQQQERRRNKTKKKVNKKISAPPNLFLLFPCNLCKQPH